MRMEKRWAGRLAAGLFLLCAAGLLWLLGAETVPGREPVFLMPETGLDGLYLYTGPLELEYTLPAPPGELRPILEIRTLSAAAELLLDGAPFQRVSEGLGWAYLTLPPDCAGKTLTLITEKGENDTVPILYLTDNLMIYEQVRADTSLCAFPAAAFGMIWLLTLGLFLFGALEGTRPWPVLLLSAAALGQAAHFYLENLPLDLLPPALYGLVLYQSRALLFAAPTLYLALGMKKRRKVFAPFAVLPALIYFVVAGFQTVIPLFSNIAARAGVVFCFTIPALLVCAVLEYRDGNPVFRFVLPGTCAGAAAALCAAALTAPETLRMILQEPLVWIETELFWWNTLLLAVCCLESVTALIRRVARRETELQVLSARESLTREQLATVRESAAALGELRHDVKNHYLVLQNLYRMGEGEGWTPI